MKDFIEFIAKHLVDNPEAVKVAEVEGEKTTVYELRVGDGDLGKVIGKSGKIIKSIRSIVSLLSSENNIFVDVAN